MITHDLVLRRGDPFCHPQAYGLRLVREPLLADVRVPARQTLRGPLDVVAFMKPFIDQEFAESFWALALDAQHRCVAPTVITRGLLTASLVHPRETFRAMLAQNANAVVLVHNHPGDDPMPSPNDRAVTRSLVHAGRHLDVPIMDHVIVTREGGHFSFAEHDLLE